MRFTVFSLFRLKTTKGNLRRWNATNWLHETATLPFDNQRHKSNDMKNIFRLDSEGLPFKYKQDYETLKNTFIFIKNKLINGTTALVWLPTLESRSTFCLKTLFANTLALRLQLKRPIVQLAKFSSFHQAATLHSRGNPTGKLLWSHIFQLRRGELGACFAFNGNSFAFVSKPLNSWSNN